MTILTGAQYAGFIFSFFTFYISSALIPFSFLKITVQFLQKNYTSVNIYTKLTVA